MTPQTAFLASHRALAPLLLALVLAGCVGGSGPKPGAGGPNYAAWPCLGASLPCGSVATREPQQKTLDGMLNGDPARGQKIAEARNKGNCLACHVLKDGAQPGSRGPDLSRYGTNKRSDAETYAMVYDMRTRNPDTLMPPFGTNAILAEQELRDVVAYLQASK